VIGRSIKSNKATIKKGKNCPCVQVSKCVSIKERERDLLIVIIRGHPRVGWCCVVLTNLTVQRWKNVRRPEVIIIISSSTASTW
jgi:hypothetical protein